MSGSWIVELSVTYESAEEATNAMEVISRDLSLVAARRGRTIRVRWDYGARSKYGAVRPAYELLHEVFDPVADDEYYRAWPDKLTLRVDWRLNPGDARDHSKLAPRPEGETKE